MGMTKIIPAVVIVVWLMAGGCTEQRDPPRKPGAAATGATSQPGAATAPVAAAVGPVLYRSDFSQTAVGKVPEDMMVLGGDFAVRAIDGKKVLELPGEPLETFGVLFGPTRVDGLAVAARVYGVAKGRRYPTFGVGVGGVGGFKVQVAPGRKTLELLKGDESVASVSYTWTPGTWTSVALQVRQVAPGRWRAEGKAWPAESAEPSEWMVRAEDTTAPPSGRPSLWGLPYSEQPIEYDELVVTAAR